MSVGDHAADPGAWYRPTSVHLQDYDEAWPELYRAEADEVAAAMGADLVAIEHVGSTAVPGMPAKPIIDILAAVSSWEQFDEIIANLRGIGYVYTPESEGDDPGRRVFRKGPEDMRSMRTHHLHVTESNSPYWRRIVAFRDQLRVDPTDAAAYAALKQHLADEFATDSRGYTRAKADFVQRIEAKRAVAAPSAVGRRPSRRGEPTARGPSTATEH